MLDDVLAHKAEDAKKLFADGHVLLIYFSHKTVESAQPIHMGHGRSIR